MKTYECKITDESSFMLLRTMNSSFSSMARRLFVNLYDRPVEDKNLLKREFQREYGISSTHYNSIKNHVDGIYRSRREIGSLYAAELRSRVKYTVASVKKLEKTATEIVASIGRITRHHKDTALHRRRLSNGQKTQKPRKLSRKQDQVPIVEQRRRLDDVRFKAHQKKRRLRAVEEKSKAINTKLKTGDWSVCFGSKKLQQKQHYLEENGYDEHCDWLEDWQFNRSNQSFWLGDTTEKLGNRNAKLDLHKATIRLTVPECLRSEYGSHLTVSGLKFDPRAEENIAAVVQSTDPTIKTAMSYRILERRRIVHDKAGQPTRVSQLYLQVAVQEVTPAVETCADTGALGIDLNCDHLAIGEVDRYGNPTQAFSLPIDMGNKTSDQITAMFGDHVKDIVAYAKLKGMPISIEKLDFRVKKSALREIHGPKMARMLSSFAYSKFMSMMASRCAGQGVKLYRVNPAFSSVLGAYNYFGLRHLYTSHQMAGFILARRGLGLNDSLKSTYNERNHTALLQTVRIAPDKAPPTFDAWIEGGGKRHRWSLLRRYYVSFSLFVKHLGSKTTKPILRRPQDHRRNIPLSPPELQVSLA